MKRGRANLDYLTREVIKPALIQAGITWHGWHAFRRELATNLYRLGVPDTVIQAILRHCNVEVTREAYIDYDAVDPQSFAAMAALQTSVNNRVQLRRLRPGPGSSYNEESKSVRSCGGMCERLKQAVLKTAVPGRVPGVRIPLPPPYFLKCVKWASRGLATTEGV